MSSYRFHNILGITVARLWLIFVANILDIQTKRVNAIKPLNFLSFVIHAFERKPGIYVYSSQLRRQSTVLKFIFLLNFHSFEAYVKG